MSWWWCVVTFVAGAIVGAVMTALIATDNDEFRKDSKRWWDDE